MTEVLILFFGLLLIFLSLFTVMTLRWTWYAYGFFVGSMVLTSSTGLNFTPGNGSSFFGLLYFFILGSFSVRYRDLFLVSLSFLDWTSWSCWGSANWTQLALCDFQALTLWISLTVVVLVFHSRSYYDYEYVLLLLLLVMSTLFLLQLDQLILIYLGLELQALILYVLVTYYRFEETHTEAGLKYLLLGSLVSGFFLLGMLLVYYQNGTLNWDELIYFDLTVYFVMILLFKLTSFPFHFWSPSVYQALDWSTFWIVSTLPKCSAWYLLIYTWYAAVEQASGLLYGLSFSSILVGSIGGLYQLSITSVMAYSGILNTGYLLLFYTLPHVIIFYLSLYFLTSGLLVSALSFGSTLIRLFRPSGWWVFFLIINLAGLPMIPGFIGKLYLLSYSLQQNYLEVILIVGSGLIAVLYYLGLISSSLFSARNHHIPFSWIYSCLVLIIVYLQLETFLELAWAVAPLFDCRKRIIGSTDKGLWTEYKAQSNNRMGLGARDNEFWTKFKSSCKEIKPVIPQENLFFQNLRKVNSNSPDKMEEFDLEKTIAEFRKKTREAIHVRELEEATAEVVTLKNDLAELKVKHLSTVSSYQEVYLELKNKIFSIIRGFSLTRIELLEVKRDNRVKSDEIQNLLSENSEQSRKIRDLEVDVEERADEVKAYRYHLGKQQLDNILHEVAKKLNVLTVDGAMTSNKQLLISYADTPVDLPPANRMRSYKAIFDKAEIELADTLYSRRWLDIYVDSDHPQTIWVKAFREDFRAQAREKIDPLIFSQEALAGGKKWTPPKTHNIAWRYTFNDATPDTVTVAEYKGIKNSITSYRSRLPRLKPGENGDATYASLTDNFFRNGWPTVHATEDLPGTQTEFYLAFSKAYKSIHSTPISSSAKCLGRSIDGSLVTYDTLAWSILHDCVAKPKSRYRLITDSDFRPSTRADVGTLPKEYHATFAAKEGVNTIVLSRPLRDNMPGMMIYYPMRELVQDIAEGRITNNDKIIAATYRCLLEICGYSKSNFKSLPVVDLTHGVLTCNFISIEINRRACVFLNGFAPLVTPSGRFAAAQRHARYAAEAVLNWFV